MKFANDASQNSIKIDIQLLAKLNKAQKILIISSAILSMVILLAWLLPFFSNMLPSGWNGMKANTALSIMLATLCLYFNDHTGSPQKLALYIGACCLIVVIAANATYGNLANQPNFMDTLLAADQGASLPGRMSIHTSIFLLLQSAILLLMKSPFRLSINLNDVLVTVQLILVLVIGSGYLFEASSLFSQSSDIFTSPQTLFCMFALTICTVIRHMNSPFFGILAGTGISGQITRFIILPALLLPFLTILMSNLALVTGLLTQPIAAALTSSVIAVTLFFSTIVIGKKINTIELALRDQSLKDDLTQIYNLRGFNQLGEYMFNQCLRDKTALEILYFDLDGLKKVNDSLGHEAGSELLENFAQILENSLSSSDLLSRVGGDEFAVISRRPGLDKALVRLGDNCEIFNNNNANIYKISYSVGFIRERFDDISAPESFDDIVAKADKLMYENKKEKKSANDSMADWHPII